MKVSREELPDEWDIVAVDADVVRYRASFSAQHTYWTLFNSDGELVDRFHSAKDADSHLQELSEFLGVDTTGYYREPELVVDDVQAALDATDTILRHLFKKVPAKEYKLYLTGKGNYREEICKSTVYKGNRQDVAKPVHHEAVRDHLVNVHGARIIDGAEADDFCGVVGYLGFKGKLKTCAASIDKDFLNVPMTFYDFVKDEWHLQSLDEANEFLWQQILTGDKVDNILGLENVSTVFREKYKLPKRKGVGPATAKAILKGCTNEAERFERVCEAYQSWYEDDWRERLQEAGKLVYIQREKGKIWNISWYE